MPARFSSPSMSAAAIENETTGHVESGGASASMSRSVGLELRIGKTVRAGVASTPPASSTARTSTTTSATDAPTGISRRIVESRCVVRAQPTSGAGGESTWNERTS